MCRQQTLDSALNVVIVTGAFTGAVFTAQTYYKRPSLTWNLALEGFNCYM